MDPATSTIIRRQFLPVAIALALWGAVAVSGVQPAAGGRVFGTPESTPTHAKSQTRNPESAPLGLHEGTHALLANPVLSYATYLGGSGFDVVTAVAVDSAGSLYLTGFTNSPDFPTVHAAQENLAAGTCGSGPDTYPCFDAFVMKLDPSRLRVVYATYFGGSGEDYGAAIAVDAAGSAYVAGYTNSTDLPTASAFQSRQGGGNCSSTPNNFPCFDAFVAKLDPEGSSLVFSTYLGGSADDYGQGIALDAAGSAVISGFTASRDFPLSHAPQDHFGGGSYDAFVAKLSPAGTALVYSTYWGGSGDDLGARIAVDAAGDAYTTGSTNSPDFATSSALQPLYAGGTCGASSSTFPCFDAFLSKLNPQGVFVYSTYLGGSGGDYGYGIAVDSSGSAYLTGQTTSVDFPVTWHALQTRGGGTSTDAFVTKLSPDGATAVYSTYLGGLGAEAGLGIAVDSAGSAYVTGYSYGDGIPLVNPLEGVSGSLFDAFLAKLDAGGEALEFSTNLGGSGNDKAHGVAVDGRGIAYLVGETFSLDFPVTSATLQPGYGGGSFDAFLAKITTQPVAILQLSAGSLGFPGQDVGTTSAPQTVTVSNVGGAAAGLGEPRVNGDFGLTNRCGTTLAPGDACALEVIFSPVAPGNRTGEVTIPSDADGSPFVLELSGTGIGPLIQLSEDVLAFEGITVGSSSTPQTIALANAGNAPLALSGITTRGDFSQENDCANDLPAGSGCAIHITFTPSAAGPRSGSLSVTNRLPEEAESASLFGMGQDFSFSASPGRAEIVAGKSVSFTLALEPAGGFDKSVTLGCSGAPAEASCVVVPTTVTLDGSSSASATVTLHTAARGQGGPESNLPPPGLFRPRHFSPVLLGMLGLLLALLTAAVLRMHLHWARAGLAAALFTALLWSACGGGGGPAPTLHSSTGTPAGTYTLTVTGTSGSLARSITVTVTVN